MHPRKRMTAMFLTALMFSAMVLSTGFAHIGSVGSRDIFLPDGLELKTPSQTPEGFTRYVNEDVQFALDVPEGYEISEPYANLVLVTDEDPQDFQVHAEYAASTVDNSHFLLSAQDFADLIESDKKYLTDWLGTTEVEVVGTGWGDVEGARCFVCAFTMNGGDTTGALYIFDGQGDFGCYCLTAILNGKSDKAELYSQQLEQMVKSFTVTGPYQMEGYTLYEMESETGIPIPFFARDTANVEQFDIGPVIYPMDGAYFDADIYISRTAWEANCDLDTVLEGCADYYFKVKDDARYTARPTHFELGIYSYDMIELEYYDIGKHYTYRVAVFTSGGYWWAVDFKAVDEYKDAVNAAFSDTLFSLRVDGDVKNAASEEAQSGQTGSDGGVGAVLDVIEAQDGFYVSEYQEPLGYVYSLPNGSQLLVAVYETKDSNSMYAVYVDAWLLGESNAVLLGRNELYKELGGNSGSVAVVTRDDAVYVKLECHLWDGDQFNNYCAYLPVNEGAACFDEGVYMEAHGTVGAEGQGEYIIDGGSCSQNDFDAAQSEYLLHAEMDIQRGHGNGDVMDFDGLRQWYP